MKRLIPLLILLASGFAAQAQAQQSQPQPQLAGFTTLLTPDQYATFSNTMVAGGASVAANVVTVSNDQGLVANASYDPDAGFLTIFVTAWPAELGALSYDGQLQAMQAGLDALYGAGQVQVMWYPTNTEVATFEQELPAILSSN